MSTDMIYPNNEFDPVRAARLITIEGPDPDLCEIVMQRFYKWACAQGIVCEHTREPTSGPVGAQIQLAQLGRLQIDPLSLALFDLADRMDHLGRADGVLAWLEQGRHVFCTGYVLTSCARHLAQVDLNWLLQINARCRVPDGTFYIRPALDRQHSAGPPYSGEGLRDVYDRAVDALRDRGHCVWVVDAAPYTAHSIDEIWEQCLVHVAEDLHVVSQFSLWEGGTRAP